MVVVIVKESATERGEREREREKERKRGLAKSSLIRCKLTNTATRACFSVSTHETGVARRLLTWQLGPIHHGLFPSPTQAAKRCLPCLRCLPCHTQAGFTHPLHFDPSADTPTPPAPTQHCLGPRSCCIPSQCIARACSSAVRFGPREHRSPSLVLSKRHHCLLTPPSSPSVTATKAPHSVVLIVSLFRPPWLASPHSSSSPPSSHLHHLVRAQHPVILCAGRRNKVSKFLLRSHTYYHINSAAYTRVPPLLQT